VLADAGTKAPEIEELSREEGNGLGGVLLPKVHDFVFI